MNEGESKRRLDGVMIEKHNWKKSKKDKRNEGEKERHLWYGNIKRTVRRLRWKRNKRNKRKGMLWSREEP